MIEKTKRKEPKIIDRSGFARPVCALFSFFSRVISQVGSVLEANMSTLDINKVDNEEESKSPDKKQIEDEEKEVMLKPDKEKDGTEPAAQTEGPVKAALTGDVTEQGREVKPKFIPIGAIKMPGFFTRNSDKDKSKEEEAANEKDDNEKTDDSSKPQHMRFRFLHTCPFTKFLHHPQNENEDGNAERVNRLAFLNNIKYPKIFQRKSATDPEAALASMETLEDKIDSPNDGMENVKLGAPEPDEGKVATKMPLKERIRQRKFIIDDIVVCVVVVLVILVATLGALLGARAAPPSARPLRLGRYMEAITSCGLVEGVRDEGVYKFYGIPYAVPPLGDKRFTYAEPLDDIALCWNGTRTAHNRTAACLQVLENGTVIGEEDCLTLDIVTPHVRYDSPLPVVVLIGANSLSGGVGPAQPSALYSRTKEVVFVRPNFRLGAFGFLALDVLSASRYPPASGNYALSDLVAALRWVQLNIRQFGGDETSVTLLAHRAGATLTAALTALPRAHQLYSRAWLSSPSVLFPGEPLQHAHDDNQRFKTLSKCSDVTCLRLITAAEVLAATPDTWLRGAVETLPSSAEVSHSWLTLDGSLLRSHVYESWARQQAARDAGNTRTVRPLVFGTTQHSAHSELLRKLHTDWTPDVVEKMVRDSVIGEKNLTTDIFAHYNKTYEGLVELISDIRTWCPLVSLARMRLNAPLYLVTGDGAGAGAGGSAGLAGGDADVAAILGTFDSATSAQRRYMGAMQQLFYNYAWHARAPPPLAAVGQDAALLPTTPHCDALIQADLVPRYARRD